MEIHKVVKKGNDYHTLCSDGEEYVIYSCDEEVCPACGEGLDW